MTKDYTPFADLGATLIANGYRIIPIRPASKIPALAAWQDTKIGPETHARMAGNGHARDGVGIVTGQPGPTGLAATLMDVDSRNKALVSAVRAWARRLKTTVERVGQAPKMGMFYRCEPGASKRKSRVFYDPGHVGDKAHAHALEWLLNGQQCVAFGIHPDTQQPYQQDGLLGDLSQVPLASLALVTEDQMAEAIRVFEAAAETLGLVPATTAPRQQAPGTGAGLGFLVGKVDASAEDLRRILAQVHVDTQDYDQWLQVGLALHHQFDGAEEGLDIWDEWSQGPEGNPATSYKDRGDLEFRWRGFTVSPDNPVTARTILKMGKDAAREQAEATLAPPADAPAPDPWGADMLAAVKFTLSQAGLAPDEVAASINLPALAGAWRGCFYDANKGKYWFLNKAGHLVQFGETKWHTQARITFGSLLTPAFVTAAQAAAARRNADPDELVENLEKATWAAFSNRVQLYRQRTAMSVSVDMFAQASTLILEPETVRVSYAHNPWPEVQQDENLEARVLADYREHFPLFDDVIGLLLHARFAADRRQAFLWMRCSSSWGKGFLIDGLLGKDGLGIVTAVSPSMIEAAFEGKPIGLDMNRFLRSWVLYSDELKSVKSEFKQLNNTLMASPKNQMQFEAPLYLKMFTSAETVDSLASSEGVEAQFAERFSAIELPQDARIDDRELFRELGKSVYRDVIVGYLARTLNAGVERLRALGRMGSAKVADEWLAQFHARHTILHGRTTLDEALPGIADEIRDLVHDYGCALAGITTPRGSGYLDKLPSQLRQALATSIITGRQGSDHVALARRPVSLIKAWIDTNLDRSHAPMLRHKASSIAAILDPRYTEVRGYATDTGARTTARAAFVLLHGEKPAFFAG